MGSKINKYVIMSIIISVMYLIFGIILFLNPTASIHIIGNILTAFLIIVGILLIIIDIKNGFELNFDMFTLGVISIVLGILNIAHPNLFATFIPIVIGLWVIINSCFNAKMAFHLDGINFALSLFIAFISLVCGLILVINPVASSNVIAVISGIAIILYSITNIVNMILFLKFINIK